MHAIQEEILVHIEDKYALDVLKLHELFPNLNYFKSDEEIINMMIKKEWIEIDRAYLNNKTNICKGIYWDKCPKKIRDHFDKIKD